MKVSLSLIALCLMVGCSKPKPCSTEWLTGESTAIVPGPTVEFWQDPKRGRCAKWNDGLTLCEFADVSDVNEGDLRRFMPRVDQCQLGGGVPLLQENEQGRIVAFACFDSPLPERDPKVHP